MDVPADVVRVLGDDAMYCANCEGWHHVDYHKRRTATYPPDVKKALGDLTDNVRRWRNRAHSTRSKLAKARLTIEHYREQSEMFDAMCDLAWHGAGTPRVQVRGTHMNWTEIVVGEYVFNIDDPYDRKRFVAWGKSMRNRELNAPLPEPRA